MADACSSSSAEHVSNQLLDVERGKAGHIYNDGEGLCLTCDMARDEWWRLRALGPARVSLPAKKKTSIESFTRRGFTANTISERCQSVVSNSKIDEQAAGRECEGGTGRKVLRGSVGCSCSVKSGEGTVGGDDQCRWFGR